MGGNRSTQVDLGSFSSIDAVIKSRSSEWTGHIIRMGKRLPA
jgi:hypothetical protein